MAGSLREIEFMESNNEKSASLECSEQEPSALPLEVSIRTLGGVICLEDFDLGVTLGTGSFGRVKFATHRSTGSIWAIKMLKKSEVIRLQQVEHMISEKNILSNLDHPFIVRLSGTFQGTQKIKIINPFY